MGSMTGTGRRAASAYTAIPRGAMMADLDKKKNDLRRMHPSKGPAALALGVARVTNIDYEEFYVTLRTMTGVEQDFERVPVPMTFPGAGARHFLGAMPEIGDYCVVGWMTQESSSSPDPGTMIPVILNWIVPGVWPGRDWVTTASFTEDEHSGAGEANNELLRGIFERVRHKLRHTQPGNVLASSSQGSDLVLDESVTLANRRGNELRLRDEDQAVVLRSLQQFHAMAGTRIYAGMVQRDAGFLATPMVSDGTAWDSLNQTIGGLPRTEEELPAAVTRPPGTLTPADVLARSLDSTGALMRPPIQVADHIDPYFFLRNGGFIDEGGQMIVANYQADAVYGGKPIYRVASQGRTNAVLDAGARTLTEYRIELAHTSDGRLPVTEQTDLFDSERLPTSDQDIPGSNPNAPYIEWVMGSVVGNDPYSAAGRKEYGLPLVPQVIRDGKIAPQIGPAKVSDEQDADPIETHAASLFRITPFLPNASPTWWSVNKKGQLKASFGGKAGEPSIEAALLGDLMLAVQGKLELDLQGGLHYVTRSRSSLAFEATDGPVTIIGGGSKQGAVGAMERQTGNAGGQDLPSVTIEAKTSAKITAARELLLKGDTVRAEGPRVVVQGNNEVEIKSSKRIKVSTEEETHSVSGRYQENFTGPKGLLPSSGPLHERTYSPNFPGMVAEKVTYQMGDREERFVLGNHTTEVLIGNLTYKTLAGSFTAQALTSTVTLDATGISQTALVGNISAAAPAGGLSMSAMTNVSIICTGGSAALKGGTLLYLGAPVTPPDVGPIITAGSREPFTGLPFLTWGLGAKNHIVGP